MPAEYGDEIYDLLISARISLLFEMPFIGTLATRLKLVEADGWCDTAATDGRNFYYNRNFIKSLAKDELLFLCGHEVFHVMFDHLGRRGQRNPKILNMAQDYVINYALKEANCGTMPKGGLWEQRFTDEMSSEEVYEILMRESVTVKDTLDMHLELGDTGENDGEGQGGEGTEYEVTILGKDGPPKLSEEELQQIRQEMRSAVIQAARAHGAGAVPKGLRRMIEDLIEPKMDWRALLDAHIRSARKSNFTFARTSRTTSALRYLAGLTPDNDDNEDIFATLRQRGVPMLPSQDVEQEIEVFCAIDCSGSETPEMIRDQLSEVKGIMMTFPAFKIWVITFDTKVYNFRTFTPENIDEIDNYPIDGGGGTLFPAIWNFMKDQGIEPHRLVVFTDGYPNGDDWGDPDYCDTLFVIHGNKRIKAPFGMTAYYEPNSPNGFGRTPDMKQAA
jgi:predicted metal-dependent peptidase